MNIKVFRIVFWLTVALIAALRGGGCLPVAAQEGVRGPAPQRRTITLAFYNTENFFDTLPGRGRSANEFTPTGPRHWNTERYSRKLQHIAQVLDTLKADVVGLAEVEGESVLRDLLVTLRTDYNYIWVGSGDYRGMGVALLYRGSVFEPLKNYRIGGWELARKILAVEGELAGKRVTILACHLPAVNNPKAQRRKAAQLLREAVDRMHKENPECRLIVMGDFNFSPRSDLARKELRLVLRDSPASHGMLYTPFSDLERNGHGTYIYRDRWYFYDYIVVNEALIRADDLCFKNEYGIFAPEFLFHTTGQRRGYPFRSYIGNVYLGGYSDHLPVWMTLEY